MRTCPKCGGRAPVWSADLFTGVCKTCSGLSSSRFIGRGILWGLLFGAAGAWLDAYAHPADANLIQVSLIDGMLFGGFLGLVAGVVAGRITTRSRTDDRRDKLTKANQENPDDGA